MKELITRWIGDHQEEIISWRRHFHQNPEISGKEFETQKKILEVLKSMGIEGQPCAGTGVVADIGPTTGRTVAIRADIDALPLSDEIDQPYCSQNEGVCHACGHDAHTAGLLGLAGAFAAHQDQLPGRIRLLFQPSEEWFDGGAKEMIEEGKPIEVGCSFCGKKYTFGADDLGKILGYQKAGGKHDPEPGAVQD